MQFREYTWSKAEKKIARKAFDRAYEREMTHIRKEISERVRTLNEPTDVWALHEYLSEKRESIDAKYDYRYSQLLFVFARLLRDGYLEERDLVGLSQDKLQAIAVLLDIDGEP